MVVVMSWQWWCVVVESSGVGRVRGCLDGVGCLLCVAER